MPVNNKWIKYENNPVLGGHYGTCFDISVLNEDGVYKMYFSWRPKKSLAVVESRDGINWSEPVIIVSPRETEEHWEDNINRPSILKKDGVYHLWYTGQYNASYTTGKSWLFYATSTDGVHFTRHSNEPVLSAEEPWEKVAVMCPHVIWDNEENIYKMWYSAGEQYEPDAIGYATSPDGINWTKYINNPVFSADIDSTWEKVKIAGAQVFKKDAWYYNFYIGYKTVDFAQIGIARSRDGISNWERYPNNPIIVPEEGKWDGEACYKPYVVYDGKKWLLWYNGRNGLDEQIGLVTHIGEEFWS